MWLKKKKEVLLLSGYICFLLLCSKLSQVEQLWTTHIYCHSLHGSGVQAQLTVCSPSHRAALQVLAKLGARLRLRAPMQACMTVGRINFLISIEYMALDLPISLTSEKVQSSLQRAYLSRSGNTQCNTYFH